MTVQQIVLDLTVCIRRFSSRDKKSQKTTTKTTEASKTCWDWEAYESGRTNGI